MKNHNERSAKRGAPYVVEKRTKLGNQRPRVCVATRVLCQPRTRVSGFVLANPEPKKSGEGDF